MSGTGGGDERTERARLLYERLVFNGESGGLSAADRELDGVEADLSLARGRIVHGRFLDGGSEDPRELVLFERARELYASLGDPRGEGESLFWIGVYHQVVRGDAETAIPLYLRSCELATRAGDTLTLSYSLRHLGIADHAAGRLDAARERLEESARLRRELGWLPGVAANMVGLIYIAAAQGRHDDASALAREAAAIAEAGGATSISRQVEDAREHLRTSVRPPS